MAINAKGALGEWSGPWSAASPQVGGTRHKYPRYFFTNRSADIRELFTWALDLLDIPWRQANAWNISVARKEAVAALDEFVGPKY